MEELPLLVEATQATEGQFSSEKRNRVTRRFGDKAIRYSSAPNKRTTNGRRSVSVTSSLTQPGHTSQANNGNSAINQYLNEIGQTALLKPEEEVALAVRIKKGDEEAKELMIKANLRLVVKIARDYDGLGVPLLDLINEGNIGLMKAVKRFDPTRGAKFSTYGSLWIKQRIRRALANQSRTIRLPVHIVDKITRLRREMLRLQENLGHEPTDEELAEEMCMTAAYVSKLNSAATPISSLDAPIGETENSGTLGDLVEDKNAHIPDEELDEKSINKMLRQAISLLSAREAEILNYRFGLDGEEVKTLAEVGRKFGVTRERVRQIQCAALNSMRRLICKIENYDNF